MTRMPGLLLIALLASACTLAIQPEDAVRPAASDLAGVYKAFAPAASSPGIEMTLTLGVDGSASWKWDYLEPDGVRTELGDWNTDKAGAVQLRFHEQQIGDEVQTYEAPNEVTLTRQADGALHQTPATAEAIGLVFYPFSALAMGDLAPAYDAAAVTAAVEAGNWTGWYKAFQPAASSPGLDRSLLLAFDQSVRWVQDYLNDEPPLVEVGAWEANGDGTVTVTITGREDEETAAPQTIVFALEEGLLTAVDYDEARHGSAGLTFYSLYGLAVATIPE